MAGHSDPAVGIRELPELGPEDRHSHRGGEEFQGADRPVRFSLVVRPRSGLFAQLECEPLGCLDVDLSVSPYVRHPAADPNGVSLGFCVDSENRAFSGSGDSARVGAALLNTDEQPSQDRSDEQWKLEACPWAAVGQEGEERRQKRLVPWEGAVDKYHAAESLPKISH